MRPIYSTQTVDVPKGGKASLFVSLLMTID